MVGFLHRDNSVRRGRQWQGRSGRVYDLVPESLQSFSMGDADLYVVAKGSHVLWVGSSLDLVADPTSRTRFRLALDCATDVMRLGSPLDRTSTIWDLEGAVPTSAPIAQAA